MSNSSMAFAVQLTKVNETLTIGLVSFQFPADLAKSRGYGWSAAGKRWEKMVSEVEILAEIKAILAEFPNLKPYEKKQDDSAGHGAKR